MASFRVPSVHAAHAFASSHCCYRVFLTSAPWRLFTTSAPWTSKSYIYIYIHKCIYTHTYVCLHMLRRYPQAVIAATGCLLLRHHGYLNMYIYIYNICTHVYIHTHMFVCICYTIIRKQSLPLEGVCCFGTTDI